MASSDPAHDHLVLAPPEWRQVLRAELVAGGFEQDVAAIIARRVIERLVRGYLRGELAEAAAAHPLDEAA
jgi:hypothetical protein